MVGIGFGTGVGAGRGGPRVRWAELGSARSSCRSRRSPSDVIGVGTACMCLRCERTAPRWTSSSPRALAKLRRHHAASSQAARFNAVFTSGPWMEMWGGLTSAEWEFPKALQVLEEAPDCLRPDEILGGSR